MGIDIAGPESATFRPAEYQRLFDRARRKGLGITVHTGESGPVDEIAEVVRYLEPSRIGHGIKAAFDPRTMHMIRERDITLEVCPTSNLNTRVVAGWDEMRWILSCSSSTASGSPSTPTARRCSRPTSATSCRRLGRLGILSVEEQQLSVEWARQASFVAGVSDLPLPRRRPAPKAELAREET